jgi:DNA-binding CsgD family transcriptional regulator
MVAGPATGFLTSREMAVLRRLADHGTRAEIGEDLSLSAETVKSHMAHIFAKLGVHDRTEAIKRGRELGLLRPAEHTSVEHDDGTFVVSASEATHYSFELARAFVHRDWKLYERLHRADARWIAPAAECQGIDEMLAREKEMSFAVPDLQMDLVRLSIDTDNNRAMFECVETATHLGPLRVGSRVYPATGKPFRLSSISVVTFDGNGLVSGVRSYFDHLEMLAQLGLTSN